MNQEEIERNITFIIDQQAKFFADIEGLKALGVQRDGQLDRLGEQLGRLSEQVEFIGRRLTRAIRLGVAEARQEREKRRQLEETFTGKLNALIDAQMRTEASLSTFKSQVEGSLSASQSRMEEMMSAFQSRMEVTMAAFQSQVGQALTEMAQAITGTNRRIDDLTKTNGQA